MTLNELEDYFKAAELPHELQLHRSTRILDVRKCVDSFIRNAKAYEGRPTAEIFIEHLLQIKYALDGL
jgi:hypothetical protein